MVWWLENYENKSIKPGVHLVFTRINGRIYPSINIMYNCLNKIYDAHDMHMLANAGVNIFNVDLTIHGQEYFKSVKTALLNSEKMPEMYPMPYCRPVALSIIMSVDETPDVNDRVDIIILKDVTKADQLLEFRKQNGKFSSMPILFWLSTVKIEDLNLLIKISGGVVVNFKKGMEEFYCETLRLCKELSKPVFYLFETLAEDFYEETSTELQILSIASSLVRDRVDGVFIFDRVASKTIPKEALRSFVRAAEIAEEEIKPNKDYFNLSFRLKTPELPPRATALAASLAAISSQASAILLVTATGASARLVASSSPPCHVIAVTVCATTARRLHLYRKIIPLLYNRAPAAKWQEEVQNRIGFGIRIALETGLCCPKAKLVVLTAAEENVGYCNRIQIIPIPYVCPEYK